MNWIKPPVNPFFALQIILFAIEILRFGQVELRYDMEQQTDPAFAANPYRHLRYIYVRSPWSEPNYRRYPVSRLTR